MSIYGKAIKAVILDWAGVTVDYGSCAPAQAFVEVFRRHGVDITTAEARGPMGRAKRDHIIEIAMLPRIADAWNKQHGRSLLDSDIQAMYDEFLPLQLEVLARETKVIPGVPAAISQLRDMGLKIGSTTGYTRALMEVVVPLAAAEGYTPDVVICADDVPEGRPAPWMNFAAAQQLDVYPFGSIIIVDDTKVGIKAGLNAGATTVAISQTGNSMGLSAEAVAALSPKDLRSRLMTIQDEFRSAGAHFVIDSVADLPDLIREIQSIAMVD